MEENTFRDFLTTDLDKLMIEEIKKGAVGGVLESQTSCPRCAVGANSRAHLKLLHNKPE